METFSRESRNTELDNLHEPLMNNDLNQFDTRNNLNHSINMSESDIPPRFSRTTNYKAFFMILASALAQGIAWTITIPVIPSLLLSALNGNVQEASYITGLVTFFGSSIEIFSNPILGNLSDKYGRKPVILFSISGAILEMILIATHVKQVQVYILAKMIQSLTGVYITTMNTIVADISHNTGKEASNYGILGSVYGVAFTLGPAIGGLVEDRYFPGASLYLCAGIMIINSIYIAVFMPETRTVESMPTQGDRESWNVFSWADINPFPKIIRLFNDPVLKWIALSFAIDGLAHGGLQSVFYLYSSEKFGWGSKEMGYFFTVLGFSLLISQGVLTSIVVNLFGEKNVIMGGYVLEAIHYIVYGAATAGWMMFIGLGIGALGFVAGPSLKGLVARQVEIQEQGSLQGSLASLATLVKPLAPLLANTLLGVCSNKDSRLYLPGAPMYAMSMLSFTALVIARKALCHPQIK